MSSLFLTGEALANEEDRVDYDECVLQRIELADKDTTVKEVKEYCEKRSDLAIFRPSKELLASEETEQDKSVTEDGEEESP